ncbi:MAG: hypothetical protein L6416_00680 [Candidatus Omnitrophica bacterium]|nr:hypothetical protein [Candidatus Omnitrophota bacterium]
MKNYSLIALCLMVFVSGCGPKFVSRYAAMEKQTSYVSIKFKMDDEDYLGKTRQEMIDMMGVPAQIFDKTDEGIKNETWIYYPEFSDNFVAIIISFQGEKVKSASYESVI